MGYITNMNASQILMVYVKIPFVMCLTVQDKGYYFIHTGNTHYEPLFFRQFNILVDHAGPIGLIKDNRLAALCDMF